MDSRRSIPLGLVGLFIIIAVQIAGFALLWSKDAPPSEYVYLPATADKTSNTSPTSAPVVVVSPPDEKALRKIIQAVLEQELTSYVRRSNTVSTTTQKLQKRQEIEEGSAINTQAWLGAVNVVETALARGTWAHSDNISILPFLPELTEAQRQKLHEKISGAIHQQLLRTDDIPIF